MSSPLNKSVLLASLFLTPTLALAEMTNGDFEQWSSSSPTGWNTIDSGISVSQETSIVKSGSNAAKVAVNTGTQSNTDFQQSVSVVSGQTYNFSVSVYHTEGNVKARLYVDGYQNYSVPSNQVNGRILLIRTRPAVPRALTSGCASMTSLDLMVPKSFT